MRLTPDRGRSAAVGLALCFLAIRPGPAADGPNAFVERLLEGARLEVERGVSYDAGYFKLPYPAGDVPSSVGACTDLIVRAFRHAGIDLQKGVHEDRMARPGFYMRNPAGEKDPNSDIDHRRCRHLVVWFRRHAEERPVSIEPGDLDDWKPGDVVFFRFQESKPYPEHVAIVSDRRAVNGVPFVIDNFPPHAGERFLATSFPIIDSRFRWRETKAGRPIAPRYTSATPSPAPTPLVITPTPAARGTPSPAPRLGEHSGGVVIRIEEAPTSPTSNRGPSSSPWVIHREAPAIDGARVPLLDRL